MRFKRYHQIIILSYSMNKNYLTDKVYLNLDDNHMYSEEGTISKPLTPTNWHHKLRDFGWMKLPRPWIIKLNSLSSLTYKNSQYGVLDCEADGDCFFHCMANAINEKEDWVNQYTSDDIRKILCDNLMEYQFQDIIGLYRIMKDADDFEEGWNPYDIHTIDDFKQQVLVGGHTYWGDYLLFTLICDILRVNIKILTHDTHVNEISIYNTMREDISEYDNIILLYENNCHFKLVGHFQDSRMVSYFRTIPNEIDCLVN